MDIPEEQADLGVKYLERMTRDRSLTPDDERLIRHLLGEPECPSHEPPWPPESSC